MTETLLVDLRLAVFALAAVAGIAVWGRHRLRPAGFLASCLLAALAVLATQRLAVLVGPAGEVAHLVAAPLLKASVAWLLAAFAWSFEGRLPRMVHLAGAALAGLAVLATVAGLAVPDTVTAAAAELGFLGLWVGVAVAAAGRLWRAGPAHRTVRTRMRLLAAAATLLAVTVLAGGADLGPVTVNVGRGLSIVAALALVVVLVPPKPLRLWWQFQVLVDLQPIDEQLAGATDAQEVARVTVPRLADLLGGATALVQRDGRVLATAGLESDEARRLASANAAGEPAEGYTARNVDDAVLLVADTPYRPLLGAEEANLLRQVLARLQLALERARLFEAHRRAQRETERAKAELEATVYGLAHDLKNPTVAIAGLVELLPDVDDPSQREQLLTQVQHSSSYLMQLIDALLELSRVGRTLTDAEPVVLEQVVDRVVERTRADAPEMQVVVDRPLPVIEANPLRVEQLLDNLVTNAVRHGARPDVTVTITAEVAPDGLCLRVADDGHGISAADREHVFDLFQRGSTTSGHGSGVGLTLVRRIAESYGGTVHLADDTRGAAFEVRLPASRVVRPTG